MLKTAVGGSILEKIILIVEPENLIRSNAAPGTAPAIAAARSTLAATPEAQRVAVAFQKPAAGTFKYELWVLQGIGATSPYLHNGSVPTLADLLKPAGSGRCRLSSARAINPSMSGSPRS